ncbi:MAG: HAD-IA family hydrolase [Chlorobi bacterium]|nr:HAD-IA family hydrolase [Chlorobiota bacterium]
MKTLKVDPRAKALIFDLDGTIADTMPVHFHAYNKVVAEYGINFTPELFKRYAGIPAGQTIQILNDKFGANMDHEEVGQVKELEYEKLMHQIKPVKPVVDLIKKYNGVLPMSVGTGGHHRLAWKTLEILGLDKYFDILVAMEDVTHYKPHPETFLRCAEKMNVDPQYCQVFEDGALGLQAARSAGMIPVDVTEYYTVTIGI